MPLTDFQTMLPLLLLFIGSGIFLRLVAKEKNRREKYLRQRLEEKIRAIREATPKQPESKESLATATAEVTAQPMTARTANPPP